MKIFLLRQGKAEYHQKKWSERVRMYVLTGYAASIAVMLGSSVLIIYLFNVFSPVSLFANVISVPLSAASIISGIIFVLFSFVHRIMAQILSVIPLMFLKLTEGIIYTFSKIPFGFVYMRSPHPLMIVFYYGLLALFLLLRKKYFGRYVIIWIGGLWCIFIIILNVYGARREVTIDILDAGSGDIVFINASRDENILINTGRGDTSYESRWILKPFLMSRGINTINNLIITSFYKRHSGGLKMILDNFRVDQVFEPNWNVYNHPIAKDYKSKIRVIGLEKDKVIIVTPDVKIQVLCGPWNRAHKKLIHSAVIVKMSYRQFSFLICPEIDAHMMDTLLREKMNEIKSAIVLLPHKWNHFGSREKSFLEALSPQYAIVTGKNDDSLQEIKHFLTSLGSIVYTTWEKGCITISVSSDGTYWQLKKFLKNQNDTI